MRTRVSVKPDFTRAGLSRALPFILVLICPALAGAAAMSDAWVDQAPSVAQVFHDIRGADEIDTRARQAAAFDVLTSAIQEWTGSLDIRNMSPRAAARQRAYLQADLKAPFGLQFDDRTCKGHACIRWRYFTSRMSYGTSIAFTREVLGRYFAPEYVTAEVNWKTTGRIDGIRPPVPSPDPGTPDSSAPYPGSVAVVRNLVLFVIAALVFFGWLLFGRRAPSAAPLSDNFGAAAWMAPPQKPSSDTAPSEGVMFGKASHPQLPPDAPGVPFVSLAEGHTLIVARTRGGKGTRVLVPTLLRYAGSMLVIDPKGENAAITARTRRDQLGHAVHIVNPWAEMADLYENLGFQPATFNPLDAIDRNDPNAVAVAQSLAGIICPASNEKDKYWQGSAANVLTGVFLWLADQPGERKTLARAREIVTLSRKDFTGILVRMAASTAFHGAIREMVSQYIDLADETYSGIMSNLAENTKFLSDPRIKDATASSSFSMRTFRESGTTVYLVIPHDRIQTHAAWLRLVIAAAMQGLKSQALAASPRRRCMFLIDEFGSIGRIDDIPRDIALMSGYGLDFTLVVQGLDQLKDHYGEARGTILNNCAWKWFCHVNDLDTAKYLSESLGKATVRTVGTSLSSGQGAKGATAGASTTYGETGRLLLEPDEILNLGRGVAILLNPLGAPCYLHPVDYWRLAGTFAHLKDAYPKFYWDPPLAYDENPYVKKEPPSGGAGMSRGEALSVFSLGESADDEAIMTRYQTMMRHLSPGDDDIARLLNEARAVLLWE